jgi:calcyclin binding protein
LTKKVEIKKEKEKDDIGANGDIMGLMKKMYDEGDDQMKQTIMKAYSESRDKKKNE